MSHPARIRNQAHQTLSNILDLVIGMQKTDMSLNGSGIIFISIVSCQKMILFTPLSIYAIHCWMGMGMSGVSLIL